MVLKSYCRVGHLLTLPLIGVNFTNILFLFGILNQPDFIFGIVKPVLRKLSTVKHLCPKSDK